MIDCTAINSEKEAPPKLRRKQTPQVRDQRFALKVGYKCARCGDRHPSLAGSKFVMLGGHRRRVCGKCGGRG